VLSWHFEEGPIEDIEHMRSRRKRLRPHLVTSMVVRQDATEAMRGEYMVMLWPRSARLASLASKPMRSREPTRTRDRPHDGSWGTRKTVSSSLVVSVGLVVSVA
jgi:hypothetical protein